MNELDDPFFCLAAIKIVDCITDHKDIDDFNEKALVNIVPTDGENVIRWLAENRYITWTKGVVSPEPKIFRAHDTIQMALENLCEKIDDDRIEKLNTKLSVINNAKDIAAALIAGSVTVAQVFGPVIT